MRFLYVKEDVGHEEFLAAAYEAETEGSEGKVLNVKAKVTTVEKVVEKKESADLQNLKQKIRVVSYNYEKCYDGKYEIKKGEGISSPKKKDMF